MGSVLGGKYRLDRVLGAGGMACVYAATHVRNADRVAVKILHRELSLDSGLRARFLREGDAANRVGHPGTVRVLDDDVAEDGSLFIVMDLLDGETLHARWARGGRKLAVREVVTFIDEVLKVLGAAHEKGIVHRDLKPENLFLTRDGQVKVLDFGLARLRESSGARTLTGQVFGTPAFMAPEQALGKTDEIDALSDLWAVGATAFTFLAGRPVHQGRTQEQTLLLSATCAAPAIASVVDDVPPLLARVIDRALAFEKADRWPSAEAMRTALLHAGSLMGVGDAHDELRPDGLQPHALRQVVAPSTSSGAEESNTVELPTLPDAPALAGGESRERRQGASVRFPFAGVIVCGFGIGIAVGVIVTLSGGSKHPAPTASEPTTTAPANPVGASSAATAQRRPSP